MAEEATVQMGVEADSAKLAVLIDECNRDDLGEKFRFLLEVYRVIEASATSLRNRKIEKKLDSLYGEPPIDVESATKALRNLGIIHNPDNAGWEPTEE